MLNQHIHSTFIIAYDVHIGKRKIKEMDASEERGKNLHAKAKDVEKQGSLL